MSVRKRMEYAISVKHKPGQLADILEVLSRARVNVLAFCGYGHESEAHVYVVPEPEGKAEKVFKKEGYAFKKSAVVGVTVASGRGAGAKLARALADAGVNIECAYASTSGKGQSTAIFGVADVEKALAALR